MVIWFGAFDVPVDPTAPVAHDWIVNELAKPEYAAARPTWFDLLAKAVSDWVNSLTIGTTRAPSGIGTVILVSIIAAVIVVAFLLFGLPRLNRRSAITGTLFGDEDDRDSAAMRRAAENAARAGDWGTAIAELFRSIARGLAERTIVMTSPGTTAHDFAVRAGLAFPTVSARLETASSIFDGVRYLDQSGTRDQFDLIVELETELRRSKPVLGADPLRESALTAGAGRQ